MCWVRAGFRANSDESIKGEILSKKQYPGLKAQLGGFEVGSWGQGVGKLGVLPPLDGGGDVRMKRGRETQKLARSEKQKCITVHAGLQHAHHPGFC